MSKIIENKVTELITDVITELNFELVGVEYITGRHPILRIYIDSPEGITVDDCANVSNQVSSLLDVEDFIQATYNLEISSPGLDYPLFTLAQYQRFIGAEVKLQLQMPVANRRNWQGKLIEINDNLIKLQIKDETIEIFAFTNIKKANIVPKF